MSYSTGEAAILTLIQALDGYDSNNSSRADWRPLNSGKSANYVVLRPGDYRLTAEGFSTNVRNWTTVIEVWRRYGSIGSPLLLQDDVVTLIEHLEKYPYLNGTAGVAQAVVAGGEGMQERLLANDVLWAVWEIELVWKEEKSVTRAE